MSDCNDYNFSKHKYLQSEYFTMEKAKVGYSTLEIGSSVVGMYAVKFFSLILYQHNEKRNKKKETNTTTIRLFVEHMV